MNPTEQNPDLIKYKKLNQVGSGSFGIVYKIEETETGKIYAAKIFLKEVDSNSQEDMLNLSREVNLNAGFDHPTVLKFIGYSSKNFQNEPKPVIITEYASNGSLSGIIDLERRAVAPRLWNDTKKLIIIYGIASGMSYLHSNRIIHRDLKPDNILMDDMLFPKISDFGLSKKLHSDKSITNKSRTGFKGTPIYEAPESLLNDEQTEASDVYAFSLIMYELLTTKIPFDGLNIIQLYNKVTSGERPPFDVPIDQPYKNLIERCWSQDPKDRPTFSQIVEELENNHDFITPLIDEEDFLDFIEFINDYKKCFNEKKIIKLENFIKNQASETFKKIDIRNYIEEQKNQSFFGRLFKPGKLYPAADLIELNEDCKYLVTQAENDPEKQFYIGTYLIEGKNGFPRKIDLGVKYLERSISGKCIESVIYLSKMLYEGKLIPKDYKKAKKYLSKTLNSKDIQVLVLYAKILFKEENYKESRKYFEICANEGDLYSMYKYAKMLFCGLGGNKNINDAQLHFKLSKIKGFYKSELYVSILLEFEKEKAFKNLPTETQHFLIKQIIKYNKDNDESNILFRLKKIYMKIKDTQMLFSNNSLSSDDFKILINHCNEINAEINFPSKQFKSMLKVVYHINPKIKICVVVSGISSISNKFGPDYLINKIIIDESVRKIDSSSFDNCTVLTEITIPPSVTSIGDNAFCGCFSLKQITMPSSLTKISNYVFVGCRSLTEITIPSSVTSIGDYAFSRCISLKQITMPSSLIKIGNYSFDKCSSLTEIAIPSSVTSIGSYAFYECSSLFDITIPSSVKSLGENAFCRCSSITEIAIPLSVKLIESNTFSECSSLKGLIIPSSVVFIGDFAFNECRGLKKIEIPSSVTHIESSAFFGCSSLTQIIIPSSVTYIGPSAFYGCSSLTQIIIPSSVVYIGSNAFSRCFSITSILFQTPSSIKSIRSSTFERCTSLTDIVIPPSVNSISKFAFKDCYKLKEVTIMHSKSIIESNAFIGCSLLKNTPIPMNKLNDETKSQLVLTVTMVGDSIAGKSCILNRYIFNKFWEDITLTIACDFYTKYINIYENKVKLQIWDTAGREISHKVARSYYRKADCAVVAFDLTEESSFDLTISYFKDLIEDAGQVPVVLFGNKCELNNKNITQFKLEKFLKEYNIKYFEGSAKENINIDAAFQYVATEAFKLRYPQNCPQLGTNKVEYNK